MVLRRCCFTLTRMLSYFKRTCERDLFFGITNLSSKIYIFCTLNKNVQIFKIDQLFILITFVIIKIFEVQDL